MFRRGTIAVVLYERGSVAVDAAKRDKAATVRLHSESSVRGLDRLTWLLYETYFRTVFTVAGTPAHSSDFLEALSCA